jgi:hypothetical protein
LNQISHLTNPHDKLSIFVLYPSFGFPSIYRLTLRDQRLGYLSLSLFTCRMEALGWRTWVLMILVFCLEWLRHGWFSISLFMDFDSPYCSVTSSLTLWAFLYTLLMLAWNEKLLLCSLDLVACIIIALSYILLLVWLDLFAACRVHWSDYTCFLCGLICSLLCVTMPWLWPMFVPSWCSPPVQMWLSVGWFLPYFEMSCCGGPHFFMLWMASGCCLWSLMIILTLVAFVPRSYAFWLALLFEWPMLVLWGV